MAWNAIASVLTAALAMAAPVGSGARVAAYPIAPVPLRELVEKSDVIATVVVRRGLHVVPPEVLRYEIVELDVEKVLKGDPGRTTIRQFNWFRTCPAPARYEPGHRALAFLDRDPEGASAAAPDGFATHALSYGSKMLEPAALALYIERVKEQLAILALPEGPERRAAQVEWIVRCAEQPATRWEGAYDLEPQGDSMATYDEERKSLFAAALTGEQRNRLKEALLAASQFESGERCLELLLRDDRDPRLIAWLVVRLREIAPPDQGKWSRDRLVIAKRLAARDDRPRVGELVNALDELYWKSDDLFGSDGEVEAIHVEELRLVTELLALFPQ